MDEILRFRVSPLQKLAEYPRMRTLQDLAPINREEPRGLPLVHRRGRARRTTGKARIIAKSAE